MLTRVGCILVICVKITRHNMLFSIYLKLRSRTLGAGWLEIWPPAFGFSIFSLSLGLKGSLSELELAETNQRLLGFTRITVMKT